MPKRLKKSAKIKSYVDWPKVKPGEILVIPKDNRLIENPPRSNSKGWPKWWKDMPKETSGTILSCKGIQDYLSLGITVPLWCDLEVFPMGRDVSAKTSDSVFDVQRFSYEQAMGSPIVEDREVPYGGFPKVVSPFLYKTAPGYSMLALPMLYEPDPRYQVLPAVVHTDFYHTLNLVLRVMSGESFIIKAGTPVLQLIPFKRKDWVKEVVLGEDTMWRQGTARGMTYGGIRHFSMKGLYRKHQREADLRDE